MHKRTKVRSLQVVYYTCDCASLNRSTCPVFYRRSNLHYICVYIVCIIPNIATPILRTYCFSPFETMHIIIILSQGFVKLKFHCTLRSYITIVIL